VSWSRESTWRANRACAVLIAVAALVPPASAIGATTVTGTLVEIHGHRADGTEVAESYAVDAGDRDRPLTDVHQPRSLIGQRVRVTDRDVAAPGLQGRVRAADDQRVAPAPGDGARSLLVILLTTPDAPQASSTPDAARTAVFTGPASADAFYEQQSAGATRFIGRLRDDGDVAGPLQIPVAVAACDYSMIAAAADAAARSAGWEPSAYDHVLYALPANASCHWLGLGDLPGRHAWINGALATNIVAHELGHNLGAHHANAYHCTDGGAAVTLSDDCASTEYGDPFDVMGNGGALMSSWHRAQVGQLPVAQQATAGQSQTVTLVTSDDFTSSGVRTLVIPRKQPGRAVTSWMSLELRSSHAPFDVWALGAPVTTGISARIVPDLTSTAQTQLLDARPATTTSRDAPLQPGESLRDEAYGITVSVGAIAGGTATVTVAMPALVDDVGPSAPQNLASSGDTNAVTLTWSPATDDDAVDHYDVERDAAIIGTTSALSFSDARVADLTVPAYRVIAVDRSGNRGASAPLHAALRDATPPSIVPGLNATTGPAQVTLSWSPAQDNRAIRSYRVIRDGVTVAQVPQTSFSDRPSGGPHRYEVRAEDTSFNPGAPAAANIVATAPRTVLSTSRWKGRVITMRFDAPGATSMRASCAGRQIAHAKGTRLTVRLRMPSRATSRKVRVVASWPAGSRAHTWTVRRPARD
jgi:Gametolysin peptidase M11